MLVKSSQQRIRSLEIAGRLLQILAEAPQALALTEIARLAGMPTSKTRRYLVSLARTGLVVQNDERGRYDVGSLGLHLGLAYLDRSDPKRVAEEAAQRLCLEINQTVCLTVKESNRAVQVFVRIGSIMPILTSASGHLFTAYLPKTVTRNLYDKELAQLARVTGIARAALRKRQEVTLEETRRHRLARVVEAPEPDMNAIAAPIFAASGNIVMVMTVVGPKSSLSIDWNGESGQALKRAAYNASRLLGYRETGERTTDLSKK